ncbi:MAG: DUF3881 family protein [Marvinbryantia sp.]|jgi:hypothetical protein
MHSFLRAIGFSNIANRRAIENLLQEVCSSCDARDAVRMENGTAFVEYRKEFASGCGLIVCGEMDENGFHRDYYFPYFATDTVSSYADIIVEKHGEKDSFAGVCEDVRIATSIIFYVSNAAKYRKEVSRSRLNDKNISVTLTGLSTDGKILLPILKKPQQDLLDMESVSNRSHLIAAAKNGDESAIESLTLEDIDTYDMISRRILREDVFSIVDTFFMPYGMECDRYQMMGEIQSYKKIRNQKTKEYIYQLSLKCNDVMMDVCINEADLLGDPAIGRRFKGEVWLQGKINYPD